MLTSDRPSRPSTARAARLDRRCLRGGGGGRGAVGAPGHAAAATRVRPQRAGCGAPAAMRRRPGIHAFGCTCRAPSASSTTVRSRRRTARRAGRRRGACRPPPPRRADPAAAAPPPESCAAARPAATRSARALRRAGRGAAAAGWAQRVGPQGRHGSTARRPRAAQDGTGAGAARQNRRAPPQRHRPRRSRSRSKAQGGGAARTRAALQHLLQLAPGILHLQLRLQQPGLRLGLAGGRRVAQRQRVGRQPRRQGLRRRLQRLPGPVGGRAGAAHREGWAGQCTHCHGDALARRSAASPPPPGVEPAQSPGGVLRHPASASHCAPPRQAAPCAAACVPPDPAPAPGRCTAR